MDKELTHQELAVSYRSVCKTAVLSLIFGIFGLSYLISSILILMPLMGIGFGLVAISNLKRFPEELIGRKAAQFGLGLSIVLLLGGAAFHTYIYMTEVPEGYERISFRMLKDDKKTPLAYSEQAEALDGKKVFLKGYVRPGNRRTNLKEFILVGDWGSCCFGGNPKITDVVAISLQNDDRINYSLRMRKIAGTFRLNKNAAPTTEKEVPRVYYQIDADIIK